MAGFAKDPVVVPIALPNAQVNVAYSANVSSQITAAGLSGEYQITSLPSFLTWDGGSLTFQGTPTTNDVGQYIIAMLFTSLNPQKEAQFSLTVVGVSNVTCKDGTPAFEVGLTPDGKFDLLTCTH